mmetsp:Transcript_3486/g.7320  ORF Transcript_3486/g.7320 Transcript_3486/m.7320 type:complete len:219 (-) Transcript_3486:9-665(-)
MSLWICASSAAMSGKSSKSKSSRTASLPCRRCEKMVCGIPGRHPLTETTVLPSRSAGAFWSARSHTSTTTCAQALVSAKSNASPHMTSTPHTGVVVLRTRLRVSSATDTVTYGAHSPPSARSGRPSACSTLTRRVPCLKSSSSMSALSLEAEPSPALVIGRSYRTSAAERTPASCSDCFADSLRCCDKSEMAPEAITSKTGDPVSGGSEVLTTPLKAG